MATLNLTSSRLVLISLLCGISWAALADTDASANPELASSAAPAAVVSTAQQVASNLAPDPQAIEEGVSRSFLRAAFTMRARRWPDGQAVRVFVHKQDHPAHRLMCKTILNMYPYQLRRSWDRLVYSGTGQAPIEVSSESEMRAKVAETPGAIGYVLNSGGDGVVVIAH